MSSTRKAKALALVTSLVLALMAVLPLTNLTVMAQATTGTLRGTVTDANGAAISGATVTVKNENTGTSTTPLAASSEGNFDVAALQPGT